MYQAGKSQTSKAPLSRSFYLLLNQIHTRTACLQIIRKALIAACSEYVWKWHNEYASDKEYRIWVNSPRESKTSLEVEEVSLAHSALLYQEAQVMAVEVAVVMAAGLGVSQDNLSAI